MLGQMRDARGRQCLVEAADSEHQRRPALTAHRVSPQNGHAVELRRLDAGQVHRNMRPAAMAAAASCQAF